MKKKRSWLCVLCLLLIVPLLPHARRVLPTDTRPLIAEKYAGWSGVLRLWLFEGWPCGAGSVSAWLNRCIARYEKRHPGVYVQPQAVDAGAIADMNHSGIQPPDMLLFPPGLLQSPEGLAPLALPDGLRPALRSVGAWHGAVFAVPVAAGGYLWARNAALLARAPGSWREAGVMPAVPGAEDWRHWGAAMLALCAGRRAGPDGGPMPESAGPAGLDLGLAPGGTPSPTPSRTPEAESAPPCRLPAGFHFDGDAWRRFLDGEAPATIVTQREVRRLQALSDRGAGPDWRLEGGGAFTDQLLCLAATQKPEDDMRPALIGEFLAFLLSDDCQGELYRAGAFSVTDAPSGYAAADPLCAMEAALRSPELRAPNCFDARWAEAADGYVRDFIAGSREAADLWADLGIRLAKNTNNIS